MQKRISTLPFHDTPEQAKKLDEVIAGLKGQAGAVMPALHQAQDIYGYLPMEVQKKIADGLGVSLEEVYGVSTFYSQFSLTPKGRNHISVCLGTACYVKGSDKVLDRIVEKLHIQPEECTEDGLFSLHRRLRPGSRHDDKRGRVRPPGPRGRGRHSGEVRGVKPMRELSLNVMDIAQNSISAGASLITITVEEDAELDELSISIGDNGRGMTPEQVEHVTDPFFTTRTTRSVGLGVPLFKMEAEMTGGRFSIESTLGGGTTTTAVFKPSSVDMIPLGDINGTVSMLVMMNPDLDFLYTRSYKPMEGERREFALDTRELRTVLGEDVPLNLPDVTGWVNEFLSENTDELLNGSQNQEGATDI